MAKATTKNSIPTISFKNVVKGFTPEQASNASDTLMLTAKPWAIFEQLTKFKRECLAADRNVANANLETEKFDDKFYDWLNKNGQYGLNIINVCKYYEVLTNMELEEFHAETLWNEPTIEHVQEFIKNGYGIDVSDATAIEFLTYLQTTESKTSNQTLQARKKTFIRSAHALTWELFRASKIANSRTLSKALTGHKTMEKASKEAERLIQAGYIVRKPEHGITAGIAQQRLMAINKSSFETKPRAIIADYKKALMTGEIIEVKYL